MILLDSSFTWPDVAVYAVGALFAYLIFRLIVKQD